MIKKVVVLGNGTMGRSIAQSFAMNGFDVNLYGRRESSLEKAIEHISSSLDQIVDIKELDASYKEDALQAITTTIDLEEAVDGVQLVIESLPEDLDLKRENYAVVEELVDDDVIIASNTSSLSLTDLTKDAKVKSRYMITHYFNPAQLVPLVELLGTNEMPENTIEEVKVALEKCGKEPIVLKKDIEGFVANRLQTAIFREATSLLEKGVASAEDIDKAVTSGIGFRWAFAGPLQTADFGGLDVWNSVTSNLAPELDDSQETAEFIQDLVADGKLGTKSGEGIYDYSSSSPEEAIKERDDNFIKLDDLKNN